MGRAAPGSGGGSRFEFVPAPDFSRLVTTVGLKAPDRVPLWEILVDFSMQSRFLGREVTAEDLPAQVEFWTKAGYDYIPLVMGMMRPGRVTADSAISRTLREQARAAGANADDEHAWNLELNSVITDQKAFETFPWTIAGKLDLRDFVGVKSLLPPKMKVVAISGKIFTLSWMLMGFENFCESLLSEEALAAAVIRKVAAIQLSALEDLLAMDHVGAIAVVDDMAYNTGPIISPGALREHIFPWYRMMARRCHETGRMFFLHSDGDLRTLIPDLIELGVDGLHPIDPTAMDIVELKRRFGDRLCLFGNVDTELLRSGTPAQVRERVMTLLRDVAPGGGFALGSGNSVPEWATLENYNAMRETVLRYG